MKRLIQILSLLLSICFALQSALTVGASAVNQSMMNVSATVPSTSAEYSMTVPGSISLGTLAADQDKVLTYNIRVHLKNANGGTLRVSAPDSGFFFLNGDRKAESLQYSNDFGIRDFTVDGDYEITAHLTVKKEDIAKLSSLGTYSAVLDFSSVFYPAGSYVPEMETWVEQMVQKHVRVMQGSDITKESMCNGLFYPQADLCAHKDGTTTVTVYCIDPIPLDTEKKRPPVEPMFVSGNMSDLLVTGTGQNDYRETTAAGSYLEMAAVKSGAKKLQFNAYGAFIPEGGTFEAASYTFTIPTSAIRSSAEGGICVNAFVKSVMNSWEQFYFVFDDVENFGQTNGSSGNSGGGNGGTGGGSGGGNGGTGSGSSGGTDNGANGGSGSGTNGGTNNGTNGGSNSGTGGDAISDSEVGVYTAKVSMRKSSDISKASMCQPMFYDYADITIEKNVATVKLYVIDPIPKYPKEGTPLKDVTFTTSAGTVKASVDSINKKNLAYAADGSFILKAGTYPSDVITVKLPVSAIENSAQGTILCSAYINVVMKTTQSFYVVFSDIKKVSSTSADGNGGAQGGEDLNGGEASNGGGDQNGGTSGDADKQEGSGNGGQTNPDKDTASGGSGADTLRIRVVAKEIWIVLALIGCVAAAILACAGYFKFIRRKRRYANKT